jgi:DNA-binding IclR family transcriptional regulator
MNDREIVSDARVVGAPIQDRQGYPLAAPIVCGPTSRISATRMKWHGELVAQAVQGVFDA